MKRDHDHHPAEAPATGAKKPYARPRLVEWGSVTDLTQGFLLNLADAPTGSQPV